MSAAKVSVNKAQAVRDYVKAHPRAKNATIAEAPRKDGVEVATAYVASVKHRKKAGRRTKSSKKKTRQGAGAAQFMQEFQEDDDHASTPESSRVEGGVQRRGFALSPPFCRVVVGHTQRFTLNLSQEANPELADGSMVQIVCETADTQGNKNVSPLEPHPRREKSLTCAWEVRGVTVTPATGVTVRVGAIVTYAVCERVLERNVEANPEGLRNVDINGYFAERDKLVTKLWPLAHENQVPSP